VVQSADASHTVKSQLSSIGMAMGPGSLSQAALSWKALFIAHGLDDQPADPAGPAGHRDVHD
jgi:hypothetical protein